MVILFALLALIVGISLPVGILYFAGFNLARLSFFFIIPFGAGIIGFAASYIFYWGLFKKNIYVSKKYFLIGMLMSLITIFGINYGEYAMTCLNSNKEIEYSFDGDHISNYTFDGETPLNFLSFTKYRIDNSSISIKRRSTSLGKVSNPIVSWIKFIIDMFGIMLGYLIVAATFNSKPFCKDCQKYNKCTPVFGIYTGDEKEFFENFNETLKSVYVNDIIDFVKKHCTTLPIKKIAHYKCTLQRCSDCRKATLSFELYELNSKNQLTLNSKFEYKEEIRADVAEKLLEEYSSTKNSTTSVEA